MMDVDSADESQESPEDLETPQARCGWCSCMFSVGSQFHAHVSECWKMKRDAPRTDDEDASADEDDTNPALVVVCAAV